MKKIILGILALAFSFACVQSQCLAPLDAVSAITENPVDEINGVFKFDYKIKADVKFTTGGRTQQVEMDYYVNSADGSILFPSGFRGFFNVNFGSYENSQGKIDGAIWLANGQMVTYFLDKKDGVKRAVTRQSRQSADGRFENDYMNMMRFFNSSAELAEHPEPMPEYIQWPTVTEGYRGELIEAGTGIKNTVDIYFDTKPTPFKTSTVMVGFMVGVMKDAVYKNCNRLVVYNRVNIGGEDSGDSIQAELRIMLPSGITFDATDYKPMFVGGDAGTDYSVKMNDFQGRMFDLMTREENMKMRRKRCRTVECSSRITAELERIEEEMDQLNCEIAHSMGVADKLDECH
ncbi:MAG: hypothetical protein AAF969_04910 [Bacteroidota bacterium]